MAQYRFSPAIVSRGKGQSAIAKAAYNARENIRDERTGEMKRHGNRPGLEFSGIFAPKNAPEWMRDRAKLWNAVELQEDGTTRRATAQLARNIELNLPHELNADERRQLVRDFVREQFVRQGMVADVAIHAPSEKGDERNYHAHILLTLREIDGDGFSAKKARHWNTDEFNLQWREKWAELGARYLEKAGFAQEADRYSYAHFDKEKQRQIAIERGDHEHAEALKEPATRHKGPQIVAMERRDIETDRGSSIERDSFTAQHETAKLKQELALIEKQIAAAEREEAAREAAHDHRPQDAPDHLQGTSAEIWRAYHRSDNPKAFAAALGEKGVALAVVTKDEAERSRTDAAAAKEQGKYAPVLRENEVVAVDDHAYVYRLNERTTGSDFGDMQRYLRALDRSTMLGVEDARDYMRHRADEEYRSGKERDRTAKSLLGISDIFDAGESEDQHLKETILDRAERRTIENERAAERPRNTRDR